MKDYSMKQNFNYILITIVTRKNFISRKNKIFESFNYQYISWMLSCETQTLIMKTFAMKSNCKRETNLCDGLYVQKKFGFKVGVLT